MPAADANGKKAPAADATGKKSTASHEEAALEDVTEAAVVLSPVLAKFVQSVARTRAA